MVVKVNGKPITVGETAKIPVSKSQIIGWSFWGLTLIGLLEVTCHTMLGVSFLGTALGGIDNIVLHTIRTVGECILQLLP